MTSIKNCYWFLILATFLGCCQLIPIQKKDTENLQTDPGIAKIQENLQQDPTIVEFPTEKRSPQMSSPFIQQTIKDQSSDHQPSVSSPHILANTQKRDTAELKKAAEEQRLEQREENASENNSKSTKKSQKTPPQDKAANDTTEEKREPQFLVASAFSPHFLSLSGVDTLSKK
ncbi:hypothetical protein Ddc_13629 [Ditylenchus destructor]|nr:hypothetical protein Ddc_13629 [Ditylenchus destructor]